MSNYIQLNNNLEKLKLLVIKDRLPGVLDSLILDNEVFIQTLCKLTEQEIQFRDQRAKTINVHVANLPINKTFNDYDFSFQPSVNKKEIIDLMTLRFIENNENVIFIGLSGVGKTHLATSIGIEAASRRICTYFITCHDLIANLKKAYNENRLEEKLKFYNKYKLLIIDEIGFLPVDKDGACLLFQLIAKRYEKKSTIITTNVTFSRWGEMFNDNVIASAILDRLVHHAHIVQIDGPSYRMKDIV